jgi:alkyl sulfatase BDS1-like metallo-beta-lactamase superfamily hydrolase
MGGRTKVLAAATDSLQKNEFAWAAQLANYVYRIDPQDTDARKIKAEALRQMAYVSTGGNDRAHLTSQALSLEGKVNIARLIPPSAAVISASPTSFVDYFRVRIDPSKRNFSRWMSPSGVRRLSCRSPGWCSGLVG